MRAIYKQPGKLIALAILAGAVLAFIVPLPAGFDPQLARTAATILAVLALIYTHMIPEHIGFLGFMLATVILGIAPVDVAFAGFTASAIWLVFGGNLISLALVHTGLSKRIGRIALSLVSLSYPKIIVLVTYASLAIGLFMPSTMSRIAILVPIALALAEQLGFKESRPGRTGIALAAGLGTYLPGAGILPANLPNVVMAGVMENAHGVQLTYGKFLLWHFPMTGILKATMLAALLIAMFPDKRNDVAEDTEPVSPISAQQRFLQILLLATVCLWATDFLHGVAPGYISLLIAVVLLVPGFGLTPADALHGKVNLAPYFQVVGILAIGGVVQHSGLGVHIAQALIDGTAPQAGEPVRNFTIVAGLSSLLCMVSTAPGAPVVLAPLAQDLAQAMGLPLFTIINIMVFGVSIQILPYVNPPFLIAMSLSNANMRDGVRLCLIMAGLNVVVLGPLTFLWWRLLGFLN